MDRMRMQTVFIVLLSMRLKTLPLNLLFISVLYSGVAVMD